MAPLLLVMLNKGDGSLTSSGPLFTGAFLLIGSFCAGYGVKEYSAGLIA
jgi:hypothetical protein